MMAARWLPAMSRTRVPALARVCQSMLAGSCAVATVKEVLSVVSVSGKPADSKGVTWVAVQDPRVFRPQQAKSINGCVPLWPGKMCRLLTHRLCRHLTP